MVGWWSVFGFGEGSRDDLIQAGGRVRGGVELELRGALPPGDRSVYSSRM